MNQTSEPPRPRRSPRSTARRISISIPAEVYDGLEELVKERGYENRSLAVSDILRKEFISDRAEKPESVMAGTICLFYDESRLGLGERVSIILRNYLKEVVASLSVMLEHNQRMEVLVVQGPTPILYELVAALRTCKGLETGKLNLTNAILPPLHGLREISETRDTHLPPNNKDQWRNQS